MSLLIFFCNVFWVIFWGCCLTLFACHLMVGPYERLPTSWWSIPNMAGSLIWTQHWQVCWLVCLASTLPLNIPFRWFNPLYLLIFDICWFCFWRYLPRFQTQRSIAQGLPNQKKQRSGSKLPNSFLTVPVVLRRCHLQLTCAARTQPRHAPQGCSTSWPVTAMLAQHLSYSTWAVSSRVGAVGCASKVCTHAHV